MNFSKAKPVELQDSVTLPGGTFTNPLEVEPRKGSREEKPTFP